MSNYPEYEPTPELDPSVGFQSYNNVERAINLLPDQFESSLNVRAIVETYSGGVQEVENLLAEIFVNSEIDTAVGSQLNQLGLLFGEKRLGRSDEEYRIALRARILINNSTGTPDEILKILKILTASNTINIFNHYPAEYAVSAKISNLDSGEDNSIINTPSNISDSLQAASPAGVGPVTTHLYLDGNAIFAEPGALLEGGVGVVDGVGEIFDLVESSGDFINYQEFAEGTQGGGFGVLAELTEEQALLEASVSAPEDWIVEEPAQSNLNFTLTVQGGGVNYGVLAETKLNGD